MRRPITPARLRYQILTFTATRTLINTGYRMVYPFLPTIARGLGVDVDAVARAITVRSSLGLFGPLLGSLADSRGRKAAMLFGLGLIVGSLLLMTGLPVYTALFGGVLLLGGGKIIFDSALQAYLGDHVHYDRRGLAIGLVEIGWSAAFLLGIPLAAWLIARGGWTAPFPYLAALILAAAVLLWRILPADPPRPASQPPLLRGVRTILARRAALAGLSISLLISGANETINIVFGVWMENAFALQIVALGATAMVIGVAELGGEGAVAGLADRLGKRRAIALGLGSSVLTSLALPVVGVSLVGGLVGLFLFYLTFEFTLVTTIALMTEMAPNVRATLMAGNVACQSLGRALGAPLGTALFASGLAANSLAAALLNGIALILLLLFIEQGK